MSVGSFFWNLIVIFFGAGNGFFVEKNVKKKMKKKNTNYYQSIELLTGTNKQKNSNSYYVYSSIKYSANVFC